MNAKKAEVMKTAVAMAQANLRGDDAAMKTLWNGTEDADMPELVGAMAALPTYVIVGMGVNQGVAYDIDGYFRHVLEGINASQAGDG